MPDIKYLIEKSKETLNEEGVKGLAKKSIRYIKGGRRVTEDYDEKEKVTSSEKSEEMARASAVTDSTSSRDDARPASSATDDNLFDLIDSMYEEEEEKE